MGLDDFIDQADIDEALRSDDVIAGALELAQRVADYWRSISPVDTGAYQDSIEVQRAGDNVYVVATDPQAHIIEYGSEDTPEFAPRARTEAYFSEGG